MHLLSYSATINADDGRALSIFGGPSLQGASSDAWLFGASHSADHAVTCSVTYQCARCWGDGVVAKARGYGSKRCPACKGKVQS